MGQLIDITKEYQTKGGDKITSLHTHPKTQEYQIYGTISTFAGLFSWNSRGECANGPSYDLIPAPVFEEKVFSGENALMVRVNDAGNLLVNSRLCSHTMVRDYITALQLALNYAVKWKEQE